MSKITGIKDLDYLVMSKMGDRDLFSFCKVNKHINTLCKNETFWRNRFVSRFGLHASEYKPQNRSWRTHYLKVVADLDLESPWSFFDDISWTINRDPKDIDFLGSKLIPLERASEKQVHRYWMLELGKEITISYPADRWGDFSDVVKTYKSTKEFTPHEVLKLVYQFYHSPAKIGVEPEKDTEEEEDEKIRLNIMGILIYFEGFRNIDGVYHLMLGS